MDRPYWFYIKAAFVIAGALFAYLAIPAGELAESLLRGDNQIMQVVEMHAMFAVFATVVFSIAAFGYLVECLNREDSKMIKKIKDVLSAYGIWNKLSVLSRFILDPRISVLLAFIGIVAITIAGALGASIAHGPDADIIVSVIYHLFF